MTAKKIYEIGEIPQMGEIPDEMYAWVIREDRLGVTEKAMQIEKMPVQKPGKDEVLVMVMAVGINYNNVWASQGIPISVIGEELGLFGIFIILCLFYVIFYWLISYAYVISNKFFASIANSIGSLCKTSVQYPFTIKAIASSVPIPL